MIPGAFNALVAKLAERLGFKAVYLSGGALSAGWAGLPDVGLLTQTEFAEQAAVLARATSLPILCDADTGFGEAVNVERTVRLFEDAGVAAIIYTDVNRDGMLGGLNLDNTLALADKISLPVIASGGLASLADVRALLAPRAQKLAGAIAGRALYDGRLDAAAALALLREARASA